LIINTKNNLKGAAVALALPGALLNLPVGLLARWVATSKARNIGWVATSKARNITPNDPNTMYGAMDVIAFKVSLFFFPFPHFSFPFLIRLARAQIIIAGFGRPSRIWCISWRRSGSGDRAPRLPHLCRCSTPGPGIEHGNSFLFVSFFSFLFSFRVMCSDECCNWTGVQHSGAGEGDGAVEAAAGGVPPGQGTPRAQFPQTDAQRPQE